MKSIKNYILSDQVRMRRFNQLFVYGIHLFQGFLNLMPPMIRNFGFKLVLDKCGENVFFDYNVYIKYPWLLRVGNEVSVNRGTQFYPAFHGNYRVIVGNNVYIAPNVSFHASGHDVNDLSQLIGGDIVIADNVWIGANAVILPGVTIAQGSVIGAGSVVTKDVPINSVAAGVPAKVIKTLSQEREV